jgi:hypothetical protein
MNVTPTAGIAAAWSAAKTSPNDQAAQQDTSETKPRRAPEDRPEPRKSPPAPEGQGTRVDVRV